MSDKFESKRLEVLRSMSLEQKALKVFELTEMTRLLLKEGIRMRNPEKSEDEIHSQYLERLKECHNSNY
jgi:hypothetical protein